ncbi:type II toxin-antitoxin system VapC family toxin [Thauera sp. ZXT1-4]|uniref:type II toxin-antitoxin system VapC family toxin n=1 Tax=Thauera sp. ZXT1-4 TaxID=3460294 RepID=UPI004040BCCA
MILVDTSVWIDHLRRTDAHLSNLLNEGRVRMHPYVLGEIALGSLQNRTVVLEAMRGLPTVTVATDDEVFRFIGTHALFGLGIGYTDAHLLAATKLSPGTRLWTRDRRLSEAAARLGIAYELAH